MLSYWHNSISRQVFPNPNISKHSFFLNKSGDVHKFTKAQTHALLQFGSQTVLYNAELVPRLFTHCLRRIRAFRRVYIIDTQSKKLSMGKSQEDNIFYILSLLQIWLLTCK